jgi:tetratricopeptide (TPR) repeat protein
VSAFLVLWLCLGADPAPAGEDKALVRAERLFDSLEFDEAAAAFEDALLQQGTRAERLRTLKGLALSNAYRGKAKRAQARFEELLALDPDAEVSSGLGPKIRKPFNAARKRMQGKPHAVLKLARRQDGQLEAVLEYPPRMATSMAVYVRHPGDLTFTVTESAVPGPVLASASPVRAVEAYAVARDSTDGVLFEAGSAEVPLRFKATEEPPPAVVAAKEPVREEPIVVEEVHKRPVWPFVVGGVGAAVAAGVVAGIVLSRPPELKLPSADRTGRLP